MKPIFPHAKVLSLTCLLGFFGLSLLAEDAKSLGKPDDLIEIKAEPPQLVIELPYATKENFFKQKFYASQRVFLRRAVVEKLSLVREALWKEGYGLKIWDGYRPLSVQKELWKVMPNPDYVADPAKGSRHNRGAALDVTLVDKEGKEVEMPTKFDDFSEKAHALSETTSLAAKHRAILKGAMEGQGFTQLKTEWWHFDAPGWEAYPVMDVSIESLAK